jgi:hypothetical protein
MTPRTLRSILATAVALASASLTACEAGDASGGATAPPAAQPVQGNAVALATLDVAATKVTFYSVPLDGQETVGIWEESSAYDKVSPVAQLFAQDPTSLEIFRALAPAGTEAPAALGRAHATEAQALGRTDLSVRTLAFDPNAAVEKSLAGCEAFELQTPPSNIISGPGKWVSEVSAVDSHPHQILGNPTTSWAVMGACNEGPNPLSFTVSYLAEWPGGQGAQIVNDSVKGNSGGRWFYAAAQWGTCTMSGSQCLGGISCQFQTPISIAGGPPQCPAKLFGVQYLLTGTPPGTQTFDLVTANWNPTIIVH